MNTPLRVNEHAFSQSIALPVITCSSRTCDTVNICNHLWNAKLINNVNRWASLVFIWSIHPQEWLKLIHFSGDDITWAFHLCREDFERNGLSSLIRAAVRDIQGEVFPEDYRCAVDSVFLDLPQPWLAAPSVAWMLKQDGILCSFFPCVPGDQILQVLFLNLCVCRHSYYSSACVCHSYCSLKIQDWFVLDFFCSLACFMFSVHAVKISLSANGL